MYLDNAYNSIYIQYTLFSVRLSYWIMKYIDIYNKLLN